MASKRRARSRRGRGTVFYDKARGRWTGQLSLGRDPETGRRKRGPKVHAATETECLDALDRQREELRTTGIVARRDTTVAMAVQDMLDNPPAEWKSANTLDVYTGHAERIKDAIGSVKLARLTVAQVDGMLRQMARDGYSRRTISGTRSLLARAIRRAERDGLVGRNAAVLADMPNAPARVSRAMTLEQVGSLLALDLTAWWRVFIVTGVMLGLRPGELLGLRWEDVDPDAGVLRVRQSLKRTSGGLAQGALKTEQSRRTLRMPAPVRAALAVLRREQAAGRLRLGEHYSGSGLVLADSAGRPVWPQQAQRGFQKLCKEAGIGRWQLRELRHTFVSQMSAAGVDVEVIADHVGHVNSNITRGVYRHLLADEVGTAAVVFDNLYGASS
jgi:integrase